MSMQALKFKESDAKRQLRHPLQSPFPAPTAKPSPSKKVRKLCDAPSKKLDSKHTAVDPAELALRHREAARKLALSMITKWKCRLEPDELQSVIDLALCEAASRYNHSHGAAFMTFLFYHLKGKLVKTISSRAKQCLLFVDDYEKARYVVCGDDDSSNVRSSEWKSLCMDLNTEMQPDEALQRRQLVELCQTACNKLRGIEREVILRIYFENKELADVTAEMGYSRGHLFRVRMRALAKIRRSVGAHCQ